MRGDMMDSINLCYEMCDYIEQNGVVKLVGNVKLRDNLKKELLHFLIYISMTDGRYGEEEKAFIKKKLGFDVSASMAADIKNRNMLGAGYITRVPETFKYFILANAGHKIKNDRYDNKEARTTVATQSANGLMSAADKKKLDDLTGGELVIQCSIPGMN